MNLTYIITGVTRDGQRFSSQTNNLIHAMGINLWRGSVWERLDNGKRKLLRRVWN